MKNLFLFTILILTTLLASAQNERRIALVMGNSAYPGGSALRNPVNDANLMSRTLQQLGFTVIKTTDATKVEMDRSILDFSRKLPNYDVALFYYAGHGVQVSGINYIIPIDAKLEDKLAVEFEAVNVDKVVNQFRRQTEKINIVILDACRNNPFRSWARGGERGFNVIPASSGTLIAFATAPGKTAADGSGNNGLYTSKLVNEMLKPQRIEDVFINTRNAVKNASGGAQEPQEWTQLSGKFYFKKGQDFNPDDININRTKAKGTIKLYAKVDGTLQINGSNKGSVSNGEILSFDVPPGNYTLKIGNWQQTASVASYKTTELTAKAEKKKSTPYDLPNQLYDSRDGKTYKIVEIGTQVWMAENLAYTGNNGHQRQITDDNEWKNNSKHDGWSCYGNKTENGDKYGVLYQWEAAKNACPEGWHLPSDDEWKQLEMYLGMAKSDVDETGWRGDPIGNKLKSTSGWNSNGNGNNESSFNALPGGYRYYNTGKFYYLGSNGDWWTSTPDGSSNAYNRRLGYSNGKVDRYGNDRQYGFSVRCVRD